MVRIKNGSISTPAEALFFIVACVMLVLCGLAAPTLRWRVRGGGAGSSGTAGKTDKNEAVLKSYVEQYTAADKEKLLIYYEHIENTLPYASTPFVANFNCHIGQRKLLLNEIQFLSYFAKKKDQLVIYIGSAPCEHLTIIQRMFPGNKYLLIDPNYHLIDLPIQYVYQNAAVVSDAGIGIYNFYKNDKVQHRRRAAANLREMQFLYGGEHDVTDPRDDVHARAMGEVRRQCLEERFNLFEDIHASAADVFVIQDYMTIELAAYLKKAKAQANPFHILFLSDIRTNLFGPVPSDMDIIYNECIQINAIRDIAPDWSMLKFHPTFWVDDPVVLQFEKYMAAGAVGAAGGSSGSSDSNIFAMIRPYVQLYAELVDKNVFDEYRAGNYWHYASDVTFLQPWAQKASSEARLIVPKSSVDAVATHNYKKADWENRFKYLNIYRQYHFNDVFIGRAAAAHDYQYCGCLDCTIEQVILLFYLQYRSNGKIAAGLRHDALTYEAVAAVLNNGVMGELAAMCGVINSHSKFGIKHKKNGICRAHGWNTRPADTYYFYMFKNAATVVRVDSALQTKTIALGADDTNFKMSSDHTAAFQPIVRQHLRLTNPNSRA